MIIFKLASDILSGIQQTLIGASTGAFINFTAIFREIVFYNRNKKKWASHIIWLFLFIAVMSISPILTWQGLISLLPAVGSALAVIGFYCTNPTHTRIIALFAQSLWLIYTVLTFNLTATVQNIVLLISAALGLMRDHMEQISKVKSEK